MLVAAERQEFAGLRRHLAGYRECRWPVDFAATGILRDSPVVLVANGPGPRLARQAVESAWTRETADALMSTGWCGGLDPRLKAGDIFLATEVRYSGGSRAVQFPKSCPPAIRGVLWSADRVAATKADKARLAGSGAGAVEMEAAAVGECAAAHGVPFYCVRVVSDAAGEEMPLDFNRYRGPDGRFQQWRIAVAAMVRPVGRIPALIRLQRQCRLAASKLGEFFADCRF